MEVLLYEKNKDVNRLISYSKQLMGEPEARNYLEVLL